MSADPIKTPLRQRLEDLRRGPLTLAVWLVAALTVGFILDVKSQRYEQVGLARAAEYEVSSSVTGRLTSLPVDLLEEVDAGQVLAVLDDSEVKARLATAQADLARLAASVAGDLRSTQVDEERLRLQTLGVRVQIESDRVEKSRLDAAVERQCSLAKDGVASQSVLDDTSFMRDAVARRIEENETLLARTEHEHREADRSREQLVTRLGQTEPQDPRLAPLQEAVRVQERRVDEIEVERRSLVLRSPVAGRVSELIAKNGETVLPGKPILTVAQLVATEVLVYVDPSIARNARIGNPVRVATERGITDSVVDRVGPSVKLLPTQLWRSPGVAEYGVPLLVKGVSGLGLVPGEKVTVRLLGASGRPPAALSKGKGT